jgi:uncharacterized integral membrane protein (TIGR00697 family)
MEHTQSLDLTFNPVAVFSKIDEAIYCGLCGFFAVILVVGNLIYQKFITISTPIHTFVLSSGAVLYPMTFLVTDLISELYGKERASFCVRFALCMNLCITILMYLLDQLPATPWSKVNNEVFHQIFGHYGRAFGSSVIACYVAQSIDVRLFLWIRKLTRGRYLWLRTNGSTCISLFLDTGLVISSLTLLGVFPADQFFKLVLNSYSWKLSFTIMSTPLFYLSVSCLRYLQARGNRVRFT